MTRPGTGQKAPAGRSATDWRRPGLYIGIGLLTVGLLAWGFAHTVRSYHDGVALAGKSSDPSPVAFTIAGETLSVPANMLRFPAEKRGGTVDGLDLLLRWPGLEGFTEENAEAFRDGTSLAPLIYVRIAARDTSLDMDERLSKVYARYFAGDAFAGPSGLTGRWMTADSGYRDEEVFYTESGPVRFAARCVSTATSEVPATCIRDVNIGTGLSMLYRFNRFYLGDWAAMDRELRAAVSSLLGE